MFTITTRVCTNESDSDADLNISDENIIQTIDRFCEELIEELEDYTINRTISL